MLRGGGLFWRVTPCAVDVPGGDRTEPPGHVPTGHLPQGHISPGHLYPGHLTPGYVPPSHLPPGHLPPRTYTPQGIYPPGHIAPQTLKCPIWFMHQVLITYCTLKSIYFAEIAFICDVGAIKLTDISSVRKG